MYTTIPKRFNPPCTMYTKHICIKIDIAFCIQFLVVFFIRLILLQCCASGCCALCVVRCSLLASIHILCVLYFLDFVSNLRFQYEKRLYSSSLDVLFHFGLFVAASSLFCGNNNIIVGVSVSMRFCHQF